MPPVAAILSIGDELVLGQSLDTNSRYLAHRLSEIGLTTQMHRTVPDDRAAIAQAIADLAAAHELVLITGGLGPTLDDLTRQALADVLTPDEPLVEDQTAVAHLEAWFARRNRTPSASNRRLALRPSTMQTLANPNGTALGLIGEQNGTHIIAMPGPPAELHPMFEASVVPQLRGLVGDEVLVTAEVCCFGLGESAIADRLGELMHRDRQPSVGTTVGVCTCTCRIRARGSRNVIEPQLEQTIAAVESRLQPFAFSQSDLRTRAAPPTLAEVVGNMLHERNETVCTAESCTGGLLGGMLTEVAGSSAYYAGGWVTYSNAMKTSQLGVPTSLIEAHGAVSAPVAQAMAIGAIERSGATYAVSITGIAGPGGGGPDKPVGTVFIGIGHRANNGAPTVDVRRLSIPGSRTMVRQRTVAAALQLLRFQVMEADAGPGGAGGAGGAERTTIAWEMPIDRASTGSSSESQVTG